MYVDQEKDIYRKKGKNRGTVDEYIRDFSKKEVAMKADNEWNVMAPEDAMLMALVNSIRDNKKNKNKRKNKDKSKKDNNTSSTTNEIETKSDEQGEKKKKKPRKIPDWKKIAPKTGEPKSKVVDEKTYYWCTKCNNGEGMWVLHKEHDESYRPKMNAANKSTSSDNKAVSYASDTKDHDGPTIKVNKTLLKNAKAYIAQFKDFQEGGAQG